MRIDDLLNDERVFINHLIAGEDISKITKDDLLSKVRFQKDILSDESEEEVVALVESTYDKVDKMTAKEWEDIKMLAPFPCLDEDL